MKKLAILLCVVLCVAMMMPLSVSAAHYNLVENPVITIPKVTPTIDGVIDANEGWSATGYLNELTAVGAWNTNPLTGTIDFNFAYTAEGLYFAATVVEIGSAYMVRFYDADGNTEYDAVYADANAPTYTNTEGGYPTVTPDGKEVPYYLLDSNTVSCPPGVTPPAAFMGVFTGNHFQLASGEDDIDGAYSWNGDVIGLSIDLLGAWEYDGFLANTDYVPQYNISLFEDGSVRVGRATSSNDGEITEMCQAAGTQTADGAVFEVMIPWDIIVEDQNDLGAVMGLSTEFTVEDVTAEGAVHRAAISWQDRFYDKESEMVDTWSRFITVCETTAAGTAGFNNAIASMGLKLQMGGEGTPPDTTTTPPTSDTTTTPTPDTDPVSDDTTTGVVTETVAVTDDKGNTVTDDKGNTVTEVVTKKPTTTTKAPTTNKTNTSSGNNSSAAQTFDAGIAVAIGALATSALGVVYSKKRK